MAYENFQLAFIVVFVLLCLQRRNMECKRSLMATNIARRTPILHFNAVQEERAIFYQFLLHRVLSAYVSRRMHWSK